MTAMISFLRTAMTMPKHWVVWMMVLVAANFVVPLFFISTLEAQLVLVAAVFAMLIQVAIFTQAGFVRLLGLGHLPWLPLVIWLAGRLDGAAGIFGLWLLILIVLNTISLLIDAVDVARYAMGERDPQLKRVS